MNINKQIETHLDAARSIACNEVERMARKILTDHQNLDEFVMRMGAYFFTYKDESKAAIHPYNKYSCGYGYNDTFKYLKPLNDFIREWNSTLCLTGIPMRFTAKGPKTTNW